MIVRDANKEDAPLASVELMRPTQGQISARSRPLDAVFRQIPIGSYRHFKGGIYVVFGYGYIVDSLAGFRNTEQQVLYVSVETGEIFCRSVKNWTEAPSPGIKRFTFLPVGS